MFKKIKELDFIKILGFILLVLGGIFMFLPFFWMVLSSIKPARELLRMPPTWIPNEFTLQNFVGVFEAMPFGRYFFNSVFVSTINTIVGVFSSALTGYIFAKYQFKGSNILFLFILGALMIPFQVIMIPLYNIAVSWGWNNSYLVLTIPYFFNIFGIFLMRQFMLTVPDDLIDAATIDGCSHFGIFFRIVLPIVKPAIAALTIFLFMASWNSYLWPLITIDSPQFTTLPLGLGKFSFYRATQYDLLIAASLMVLLPIIIVFIIAQKQFIRGIALSGMKE
ncbi:MAG: carbohydrate ABC transporter permease [Halanaerobiales bacterium]|nr:carbohydrate ABC transporter permease [Halanaerobiales bacterium]